MGDGPDWRQVDRARLLAARAQGEETARKKMTEEWITWLGEIRRYAEETFASGPELLEYLDDKELELRARRAVFGHVPAPLPEAKATPEPEANPAPLAETKPPV
jgi:hypothetical protein